MADSSEVSKWAGVGMAFLAAAGGYVGSVTSKSSEDGALKMQVQMVQAAVREHDDREREFEQNITGKISDIEARVRVLEAKK